MFNHVLQKTQILLLVIWLLFTYLSLSLPLPPQMSGCPLGRGGAMRQVTFQTIRLSKSDLQVKSSVPHLWSEFSKTMRQGIHTWTKNNTANESRTAVLRFSTETLCIAVTNTNKAAQKILPKVYLFGQHTCMPVADPGERPGGPGLPPLIFWPKWGPKKIFLETAPPHLISGFGWTPPPYYLKVWIFHCMPLRVNKWTAFRGCRHVSDTTT